MVIRKETLSQLENMLYMAVDYGAGAAEFFDLVAAGRAKEECQKQVLSPDERKRAMEWLAQVQEDCPIVIRVPACPMYPLLLQQQEIQPRHFPKEMLRRIPYYGRACAAGMPFGYLVVRANGEINPCMLLQANLGNIREKSIRFLPGVCAELGWKRRYCLQSKTYPLAKPQHPQGSFSDMRR
ncbi:hypothetical protein ES705_22789 [subsurface metagenome]